MILALLLLLSLAISAHAQIPPALTSVCELFRNLPSNDGKQLRVQGDVVVSTEGAFVGAVLCDHTDDGQRVALLLRPSPAASNANRERFPKLASAAGKLLQDRNPIEARGTFSGRLQLLAKGGEFPAELQFDSVDDLQLRVLPDPETIVPICELFQNLPSFKGKRVAVRGVQSDGAWLDADSNCKGEFVTHGYRWPVRLSIGSPRHGGQWVQTISPQQRTKALREPRLVTYVGRLRMFEKYIGDCHAAGSGFGHMGEAAAELIPDSMAVDAESWNPPRSPATNEEAEEWPPCVADPQECASAAAGTLMQAVRLGCLNRAEAFLAAPGNSEQALLTALELAVQVGNPAMASMLIRYGAPLNPREVPIWTPLATAANLRKPSWVKFLLDAGAPVSSASQYFVLNGFTDLRTARILLQAGLNPNVRNQQGETALMRAAARGLEPSVELLLEFHADMDAKDLLGRNALDFARASNHAKVIGRLSPKQER